VQDIFPTPRSPDNLCTPVIVREVTQRYYKKGTRLQPTANERNPVRKKPINKFYFSVGFEALLTQGLRVSRGQGSTFMHATLPKY
jgi:hypothetical protein